MNKTINTIGGELFEQTRKYSELFDEYLRFNKRGENEYKIKQNLVNRKRIIRAAIKILNDHYSFLASSVPLERLNAIAEYWNKHAELLEISDRVSYDQTVPKVSKQSTLTDLQDIDSCRNGVEISDEELFVEVCA